MAITPLAREVCYPSELERSAIYPSSDDFRKRLELGGILVDHIDHATAMRRLERFADSGSAHQVITVNLDFLSIARRDAMFRDTINQADLAVADGMPLVWLSRLRGQRLSTRITGVDLVHGCCRIAARDHRSVFLLGAGPGIAEAAARRMEELYPGLRIAGVCSPPFGPLPPAEDLAIVDQVRRAAPDFLFVALGAPRQDLWIHAHRDRLAVPVAMGVGCVLDLLAGAVQRAPGWMQQTGLEWSYRLVQEPGRLWRRYLVDDAPFFGRLVLESLREPRRPSAPEAVALVEPRA